MPDEWGRWWDVGRMRFHISRHHAERLELRGISQENVRLVVQYGERKPAPGRPKNGGRVFRFSRKVGCVTLCVVAEVRREECWLVTCYET